jgi:hypothetical protein
MNNVLLRVHVQYIQSFIVRVLPEQSTYRLRVALRRAYTTIHVYWMGYCNLFYYLRIY